jgi:hypothetical protein
VRLASRIERIVARKPKLHARLVAVSALEDVDVLLGTGHGDDLNQSALG